MPTRILGTTGESVSAVGLGGFHMGRTSLRRREAVRIIRLAHDQGLLTVMANLWEDNERKSEIRLRKAVKDGYREKAFVITNVVGRTKKEATRQIN